MRINSIAALAVGTTWKPKCAVTAKVSTVRTFGTGMTGVANGSWGGDTIGKAYPISKHHMLWFIHDDQYPTVKELLFQNIICYGLSCAACL